MQDRIDITRLANIAVEAGKIIMNYYQTDTLGIFHKSDRSPVTEADYAAHEYICHQLNDLTPQIPILSEEGGMIDYNTRRHWSSLWIVDPLDGTSEFIHRTCHFAVCIGLVRDGFPVMGVIYLPALQELFFADGQHTFKQLPDGTTVKLSVPEKPLCWPWRAVCSKGKLPEPDRTFLQLLHIPYAKPLGSALKYCALAEGKADIFFRTRKNQEWDSAAGQAIIEQAGGHVLDLKGNRFSYNKKQLNNPPFVCLGFADKSLVISALSSLSQQTRN